MDEDKKFFEAFKICYNIKNDFSIVQFKILLNTYFTTPDEIIKYAYYEDFKRSLSEKIQNIVDTTETVQEGFVKDRYSLTGDFSEVGDSMFILKNLNIEKLLIKIDESNADKCSKKESIDKFVKALLDFEKELLVCNFDLLFEEIDDQEVKKQTLIKKEKTIKDISTFIEEELNKKVNGVKIEILFDKYTIDDLYRLFCYYSNDTHRKWDKYNCIESIEDIKEECKRLKLEIYKYACDQTPQGIYHVSLNEYNKLKEDKKLLLPKLTVPIDEYINTPFTERLFKQYFQKTLYHIEYTKEEMEKGLPIIGSILIY